MNLDLSQLELGFPSLEAVRRMPEVYTSVTHLLFQYEQDAHDRMVAAR